MEYNVRTVDGVDFIYVGNDGNYTALIMPVMVKEEFIGQDKITPEQRGWN